MGKCSIGQIDNSKWYLPLRCQSMPKIASYVNLKGRDLFIRINPINSRRWGNHCEYFAHVLFYSITSTTPQSSVSRLPSLESAIRPLCCCMRHVRYRTPRVPAADTKNKCLIRLRRTKMSKIIVRSKFPLYFKLLILFKYWALLFRSSLAHTLLL